MRVAIFTCDEYIRILGATHYFLNEFWPNCPYPIELVGETFGVKLFENTRMMGKGQWCDVAIRYFSLLDPDELVLLLLDDYILSEPVKTDLIERYRNLMVSNPDIAYIRLVPCPGPWRVSEWDYLDLGEFDRRQDYLISLQATIWRTKDMMNFLVRGWNPWQFELGGTERVRDYEGRFIGVQTYDAIHYRNLVLKGVIIANQQQWIENYVTEHGGWN